MRKGQFDRGVELIFSEWQKPRQGDLLVPHRREVRLQAQLLR